MMDTYFEPLCPAAPLSGDDVIEDLCNAVATALRGRAELLPSDSYGSYSATVTVRLKLIDVDRVELEQAVSIGTRDPEGITKTVEVTIPQADALEVRGRSELPEPDFEKEASTLPAQPRRWYTPRQPRNNDASK